MEHEERPVRHNNLSLILAFFGAAMITSSVYKKEIEPYRAAARDAVANVLSIGTRAQAAPAPVPPAIK